MDEEATVDSCLRRNDMLVESRVSLFENRRAATPN